MSISLLSGIFGNLNQSLASSFGSFDPWQSQDSSAQTATQSTSSSDTVSLGSPGSSQFITAGDGYSAVQLGNMYLYSGQDMSYISDLTNGPNGVNGYVVESMPGYANISDYINGVDPSLTATSR